MFKCNLCGRQVSGKGAYAGRKCYQWTPAGGFCQGTLIPAETAPYECASPACGQKMWAMPPDRACPKCGWHDIRRTGSV